MLGRAFISLKTVTKSYVFNRTCKKDIYQLKTLSARLRRVDGPKEYVNPRGELPVIPHLYISQNAPYLPPPPRLSLPMKVYEGGTVSVKNGL